jgi:hypothetical protein
MEAEVEECIGARRGVSSGEPARMLGLSEESATRFIALLASAGRLRFDTVALVERPANPAAPSG